MMMIVEKERMLKIRMEGEENEGKGKWRRWRNDKKNGKKKE